MLSKKLTGKKREVLEILGQEHVEGVSLFTKEDGISSFHAMISDGLVTGYGSNRKITGKGEEALKKGSYSVGHS